MMKQMRENTKVILWIVVVAFVVTIFAVWGLDLRGTGGGPSASQYNTVGKVNGTPIARSQYQAMYEQLASQMRQAQPDRNLSYSQQEMVRDQVWENLVTSILTNQVIDEMGIEVTDEEVVAFLMTSPPPEIQQYFVDEAGNFDFAAYQEQLRNPDADWTAVEALARERIPRIKLNSYLMAQVHVSPDEVREVYEEENTLITAKYVKFPLSEEDISGYVPSQEEVQSYYDRHTKDFKKGETATAEYVKIPIEPTDADLDDLMFVANQLHGDIVNGEEFGEIARHHSQAATANVGGETGFITASLRDQKVMARVAIMNENQVSDPIQTDDGIYIVKLIEKKEEEGEARFNIQEIFLELAAGRETIDSLIALARDVREKAVDKGLSEAATEAGLATKTTAPFQRDFPIPGLGFVPSVSRFAFNNKPGALSNIIGDDDNYYIVRVVERSPASVQPLKEVRAIIEERLKHEQQKTMAFRKAEGFHRKLTTSTATMEEAAQDYGVEVKSPEPFRFVDPLEDMPARSPFAYAALRIQKNAISPPVESGGAIVVFKLIDRSPMEQEDFVQSAPAIAERLRQEKVRSYVTYWYEQLKENAEIEDFRENA